MNRDGGDAVRRVDYVVLSHVIVDDLRFAAGGERRGVLGGAGTYAAAGLRLAARNVGIACGVGDDFAGSTHDAWFGANGIDTAGLEPRGCRTPRSTVVYHGEDTRTESPVFGEQHFTRMRPRIDRLPAAYRAARGYYVFRDHDAAFWREAAALRAATGAVVLWELHAAAAATARWPAVAARLANVDVVSLNLAEGRRLCTTQGERTPLDLQTPPGVPTPTRPEAPIAEAREIAARLLTTGVGGVALRLGAHGALLARPPAEFRYIPASPAAVVDATGAGNAFGGALLAAVAAGEDWLRAGCGAAAAAALMLTQHGPPPRLDACRSEWRRRRDALLARLRDGAPRGAGPLGSAPGPDQARRGSSVGAPLPGATPDRGMARPCRVSGGGGEFGGGALPRGDSGAGVAPGRALRCGISGGGVPNRAAPARGRARRGSALGVGEAGSGARGASDGAFGLATRAGAKP